MPSTNLENKVKIFNAKYDVALNPTAIAEEIRINAVFDEYRFDKKDEKITNATTYWKNLTKTLENSLKTKTKINVNGIYDLSDFDMVSFVKSFEEIMQLSNEESANPRARKPYEGMVFENIIEKLKANTAAYDKPIYSIWANKIADKKLSYKELKSVTDESIRRINNIEDAGRVNVDRYDLANVVYAREAMVRVRQSRGRLWKLFHLYQNSKEKEYLESLSARITEYNGKNYPINDVLQEGSNSIMQSVYRNTEYSLNHIDSKRIEKKIQEETKQKEEKRREISAVAETLQTAVNDASFNTKITDEIVKALPKCNQNKRTQKTIVSSFATKPLIKEAQSANERFDSSVADGGNPEKAMGYNVASVFSKAYKLTESLGYIDPKDQLVAAQAITDVIIKNVSPATLEPEKFAKFTSGYALNNPDLIEDTIGMDRTEFAFTEAQKTYAEMDRESIEVSELNNVKKDIVVKPVEKESNINPPIIEKK